MTEVTKKSILVPSEDIVVRIIEDEMIIIPLVSEIGGEEQDALFTLNEIGRTIWEKFDDSTTLGDIIDKLVKEFDGPKDVIEEDIIGFATELTNRGFLILNEAE
jgi:hypothetical protein